MPFEDKVFILQLTDILTLVENSNFPLFTDYWSKIAGVNIEGGQAKIGGGHCRSGQ